MIIPFPYNIYKEVINRNNSQSKTINQTAVNRQLFNKGLNKFSMCSHTDNRIEICLFLQSVFSESILNIFSTSNLKVSNSFFNKLYKISATVTNYIYIY